MTRLTKDALGAYRKGLDDITSRADSRVEKNGQLSGPLGSTDFARAHDLVECVQGTNRAVELATTFKRPTSVHRVSTDTQATNRGWKQ